MAQGLDATLCHHLDRQAAVEIRRILFPFAEFGLVARDQGRDKGFILFLVERAIDVIRTRPAGPALS